MTKRTAEHWTPLFEGITTSVRFAELPDHAARLFYLMLLTQLDDYGRATADPRKLTALVWPMLGMTVEQTLAALLACRKVGLIEVFEPRSGQPGPERAMTGQAGPSRAILVNCEHEAKAGTVGKRDHRRVSVYPDPAQCDLAGPDWPEVARTGPGWPSRGGARDLGLSSSPGSGSSSSEPEKKHSGNSQGGRSKPADLEALLAEEPELATSLVFRAAWGEWVQHRREKKLSPYRETAARACLRELAHMGPDGAAAAIRHSIAKDWKSIHAPNVSGANGTNGVPPEPKGYAAIREVMRQQAEQRQRAAGSAS